MESKFWNCLCACRRRSCGSLWQTCAWQGRSTLHFTSTRTRVAANLLQGTPTDRYLFNQPKYRWVKARLQFQLCSTLTAHISRKGPKGIPNRPVYRKCIHIIHYIVYDVMSDIVSYIRFRLIGQSVVSTMTDL